MGKNPIEESINLAKKNAARAEQNYRYQNKRV
jgi:hypothetical protein